VDAFQSDARITNPACVLGFVYSENLTAFNSGQFTAGHMLRALMPTPVLPESPGCIFGNPGAASASGRLETETQASSAHPDRPALLDHTAECLVAMVGCVSDR
jgi:hypothetical protein